MSAITVQDITSRNGGLPETFDNTLLSYIHKSSICPLKEPFVS